MASENYNTRTFEEALNDLQENPELDIETQVHEAGQPAPRHPLQAIVNFLADDEDREAQPSTPSASSDGLYTAQNVSADDPRLAGENIQEEEDLSFDYSPLAEENMQGEQEAEVEGREADDEAEEEEASGVVPQGTAQNFQQHTAAARTNSRLIAGSRRSRSRQYPLLSSERPRIPSLSHYRHQIGTTTLMIGQGMDAGRNMMAIYVDIDDQPRTRYNLVVERGSHKWPRYPPFEGTYLPAGLSLREICQHYPRHVWGTGLRVFMAEGWSGEMIWHNLPADARNARCNGRPWNYLQQALGREADRMNVEGGMGRRVIVPKRRRSQIDDEDQNGDGDDEESEDEESASDSTGTNPLPASQLTVVQEPDLEPPSSPLGSLQNLLYEPLPSLGPTEPEPWLLDAELFADTPAQTMAQLEGVIPTTPIEEMDTLDLIQLWTRQVYAQQLLWERQVVIEPARFWHLGIADNFTLAQRARLSWVGNWADAMVTRWNLSPQHLNHEYRSQPVYIFLEIQARTDGRAMVAHGFHDSAALQSERLRLAWVQAARLEVQWTVRIGTMVRLLLAR